MVKIRKRCVALLKRSDRELVRVFDSERSRSFGQGWPFDPDGGQARRLLKIKPILEVSKNTEGKVGVYEKVRTQNKAIKKAVEKIAEDVPNGEITCFLRSIRETKRAQSLPKLN
ncbi:DegV family protein [Dubosiella newyorkensis]|uniref:DegV family protein n=1 Tax=Dubosiella newyorkensis TaxID=1862672 RepID=UPI003F67A1DF